MYVAYFLTEAAQSNKIPAQDDITSRSMYVVYFFTAAAQKYKIQIKIRLVGEP